MIKNSVLEAMSTHGGKFASTLADLYAVADSENKEKLEVTFSNIFAFYKEMDDVPCTCGLDEDGYINHTINCKSFF